MILFDKHDPKKAKKNQEKHEGVTFEEGETVLYDNDALTIIDNESDPAEERAVTTGMSASGRVLVVAYTYRGERVRSSRRAKQNQGNEGTTATDEK
jgi:uncharacterized protein